MKTLLKITIAFALLAGITSCGASKKSGCYFKEKMSGY